MADIVAYNTMNIEVESLAHLSGRQGAQLQSYPIATDHEVDLLMNFGAKKLEWKRVGHMKMFWDLR